MRSSSATEREGEVGEAPAEPNQSNTNTVFNSAGRNENLGSTFVRVHPGSGPHRSSKLPLPDPLASEERRQNTRSRTYRKDGKRAIFIAGGWPSEKLCSKNKRSRIYDELILASRWSAVNKLSPLMRCTGHQVKRTSSPERFAHQHGQRHEDHEWTPGSQGGPNQIVRSHDLKR